MNKKIIVIAGSFEQFNYYKREYSEDEQNRLIYADRLESIMGVEVERVYIVGTAYERKDYYKILENAESRIR